MKVGHLFVGGELGEISGKVFGWRCIDIRLVASDLIERGIDDGCTSESREEGLVRHGEQDAGMRGGPGASGPARLVMR